MPSVDGAASVAASDGTAPADDSRAPTASLTDAAEGTLLLVAGSADAADAAATAEDAGAPPTEAAKGTVPPVAGAAVNAAIPSAEAGTLAAPPTDAVGKTVTPIAGTAAASVTAVGADCCGPDTSGTGPPWQSISTTRCACPCAMLFASPFTGGSSRQAYL